MNRKLLIYGGIGLAVGVAAGINYFLHPGKGRRRKERLKKLPTEVSMKIAEVVYKVIPESVKSATDHGLRHLSRRVNGQLIDNEGVVTYTNSKTNKRIRYGLHVARSLISTKHPLLIHIIPMRRCNLSCVYCNEYDKHSDPVPLDEMYRRIDRLAELGSSIVTISGGEPMMHDGIFQIIARIRDHGMIAGLITNGYYLQPEKIAALNTAGLDELQISIDNVNPDDVSNKSLKVLDAKLINLKENARFTVNINSVLGSGVANPEDALTIAKRARQLGFSSTVGIIHDSEGSIKNGLEKGLGAREKEVYREIKCLPQPSYARFNKFQDELVAGNELTWRCRSGARYLYVDEHGLVSWCSQQRGTPGIPLLQYTQDDIDREYITEKWCAPTCTIQCVHQISIPDKWRDPQVSMREFLNRPSQDRPKKTTINKVLSEDWG